MWRNRIRRRQSSSETTSEDKSTTQTTNTTTTNANASANITANGQPSFSKKSLEIELAKKEVIIKLQADSLMEANNQIRKLLEQASLQTEVITQQKEQIQIIQQQLQKEEGKEDQPEESTANNEHIRTSETNNNEASDDQQTKESSTPITKPIRKSVSFDGDNSDSAQVQEYKDKIKTLESTVERLENIIQEMTLYMDKDDGEEPITQTIAEEEENDDGEEDGDSGLEDESVDEYSPTSTKQQQQQQQQPTTPIATTPTTPITPTSPRNCLPPGQKLLLLESSAPGSHTNVGNNQRRLQTILQGYYLHPEDLQILDGCDPNLKTLRDDLFRISGLHAVYPQLFLVSVQDNDLIFVGDFDALLELHDQQLLAETLGIVPVEEE